MLSLSSMFFDLFLSARSNLGSYFRTMLRLNPCSCKTIHFLQSFLTSPINPSYTKVDRSHTQTNHAPTKSCINKKKKYPTPSLKSQYYSKVLTPSASNPTSHDLPKSFFLCSRKFIGVTHSRNEPSLGVDFLSPVSVEPWRMFGRLTSRLLVGILT